MLDSQTKKRYAPSSLLLLFLYITVAVVILFRVNIEATGYLSPDSKAYLGLVQNIKDGHGLFIVSEGGSDRRYFSTWPVGYPVLIYLVSAITSTSVYWASKILNLLLLAFSFLLLRHINKQYSFVLASAYCSYTLLDVYSFTWSEAPFLLGLLYLCFLANKILSGDDTAKSMMLLFLACAFLFLMRYIGAFSFSVPALLGCYLYFLKRERTAAKLLLVSFLLGAMAGGYLYLNYHLSGFATGFDRLEAETESAIGFVWMMAEGVLNEFLIIRKFRVGNQPDYLLYFTALLQVAVLVFIIVKLRKHHHLLEELRRNSFSIISLLVALLYLSAIVLLRSLSHFDDLDYRLLAPFSFLFWIGIVNALVSLPDFFKSTVQAKKLVFVFFMVSLLLNLPKQYIVEKVIPLLP